MYFWIILLVPDYRRPIHFGFLLVLDCRYSMYFWPNWCIFSEVSSRTVFSRSILGGNVFDLSQAKPVRVGSDVFKWGDINSLRIRGGIETTSC